ATDTERRNVLLISIDTLRADQLDLYGSEYPTSPRIDAFARQGTIFDEVMAPWPSTLISHMSMLTGIYPASFTGIFKVGHPLPEAIPTLPEILARAGYSTAAVTEDGWIVPSLGFLRGFDSYSENRGVMFADTRGEAARTFADGLEWMSR